MKRTPYQRIVRAAERGTGCRLTAEEVAALAADDAIATSASLDDERARLPEDEAAHFDCFVPVELAHLSERRTCDGDGWHGCRACGKFGRGKP